MSLVKKITYSSSFIIHLTISYKYCTLFGLKGTLAIVVRNKRGFRYYCINISIIIKPRHNGRLEIYTLHRTN